MTSVEPYNFSWLVPNVLCASAHPNQRDLSYLRKIGVSHSVCLATEYLPDSPPDGLTLHSIDVTEFEAPSIDQINQFIGICEKAKEENKAVHVFCRMGLGRTGTMLACFMVRFHAHIPQAAIGFVRQYRPYSIETQDQEFAVKQYWDSITFKK